MTMSTLRAALTACLILGVAPAAAQSYSPADLDTAFERDTIVIRASAHACYKFDVWIARSRPQLSRGLMFVRDLAPDTGMLFIYGQPRRVSMWMKNTYIPLDMLFIRGDGTISSIVDNTEPLSLASVSSIEPVRFVLELGGGVAEALRLQPGDQMFWSGSL